MKRQNDQKREPKERKRGGGGGEGVWGLGIINLSQFFMSRFWCGNYKCNLKEEPFTKMVNCNFIKCRYRYIHQTRHVIKARRKQLTMKTNA